MLAQAEQLLKLQPPQIAAYIPKDLLFEGRA